MFLTKKEKKNYIIFCTFFCLFLALSAFIINLFLQKKQEEEEGEAEKTLRFLSFLDKLKQGHMIDIER